MNKTWLIFTYELKTVITSKSFLITLFLIPLVSMVTMLVIGIYGKNTGSVVTQVFNPAPTVTLPDGYVDNAAMIHGFPAEVSADRFLSFPDEAAAQNAVAAGKISAYYIIPQDYIQSGELIYIRKDYNPLSGMSQSTEFEDVLRFNLLNADSQLYQQVYQPVQIKQVNLSPEPVRDPDSGLTFFIPYIVTFLFYLVIMTSASLLMNNINTEKQNRVLEILFSSVSPTQILTGKIIALGLTGLLQTVVWSGTGLLLLRFSGRSLDLSSAFQLPVTILLWGVLFFILGYAIYASLMAGIGALVTNLREASTVTTVVIIPLVLPLMFANNLAQDPNGTLSVVFSMIPFCAPVAMMARLAAGTIPLWQPVVAAVLCAITAWLIVRGVSGMFRAQTMLSGQPLKLKRYLRAFRGKA
jgi:ABC-2 type transport system permease protein